MAMTVRRPRLLAADLSETRRLEPTQMSLQLELKNVSTGQITLPEGRAGISMHDFVECFTAAGSVGVFRATSFDETLKREQVVNLRHAIDTLSDSVWDAQTDYDGTVPDFLQKLFARQKTVRWQLGTVADTADYKRSGINYDKLSDLFQQLLDDRHDFYPVYDFTTTPWTVSIAALPSGAACEFRLARNVEQCRINRTDADLCTRLYLSVCNKKNVSVRVYNNAAAQAAYGIVEKTADVDVSDVADPDAWATDFMARRADPSVTISVDGYQLSSLTGDSWDAFSLGRLCRVALPDYGETYLERVVSVSYPDPLGQPIRVTVELANHLAKFSESIASLKKAAGAAGGAAKGAGRAAAGNAEEITQWSQVVTEHTEALDGTGITELHETGIVLDTQSGATIYSLIEGMQANRSVINVNSNAITQRVQIGDVATQLSVEAGNVSISGGNLIVDGYATVQALTTTNQNLANYMAGSLTASRLNTNRIDTGVLNVASDGSFSALGHSVSWQSKYVCTGRGSITMPSITLSSNQRNWNYTYNGSTYSQSGYIVTGYSSGSVGSASYETIYYLGR